MILSSSSEKTRRQSGTYDGHLTAGEIGVSRDLHFELGALYSYSSMSK